MLQVNKFYLITPTSPLLALKDGLYLIVATSASFEGDMFQVEGDSRPHLFNQYKVKPALVATTKSPMVGGRYLINAKYAGSYSLGGVYKISKVSGNGFQVEERPGVTLIIDYYDFTFADDHTMDIVINRMQSLAIQNTIDNSSIYRLVGRINELHLESNVLRSMNEKLGKENAATKAELNRIQNLVKQMTSSSA